MQKLRKLVWLYRVWKMRKQVQLAIEVGVETLWEAGNDPAMQQCEEDRECAAQDLQIAEELDVLRTYWQ